MPAFLCAVCISGRPYANRFFYGRLEGFFLFSSAALISLILLSSPSLHFFLRAQPSAPVDVKTEPAVAGSAGDAAVGGDVTGMWRVLMQLNVVYGDPMRA